MDEEAELQGLRAYAAMLNTLDATRLEPLLADDFVYESQMVFMPLTSKGAFLEYIGQKLEAVRRSGEPVFAELGHVSAYRATQPCVILAQGDAEKLIGFVVATAEGGLLKRLDLCIAPPADTALRSGEYPT